MVWLISRALEGVGDSGCSGQGERRGPGPETASFSTARDAKLRARAPAVRGAERNTVFAPRDLGGCKGEKRQGLPPTGSHWRPGLPQRGATSNARGAHKTTSCDGWFASGSHRGPVWATGVLMRSPRGGGGKGTSRLRATLFSPRGLGVRARGAQRRVSCAVCAGRGGTCAK